MDTALSSALDEDTLVVMQDKLSDVLSDINQQVLHGLEDVNSCLQALAIGNPPLTPSLMDPTPPGDQSTTLDQCIIPATPKSVALIPIWRSEYATCHKSHKQNLQQSEDPGVPSQSDHGDTSIMIMHDITGAPAVCDNPNSPPTEPSLVQLSMPQSSHQNTIKSIANQWTLNDDQHRAFNIVTNHSILPSEKPALKMLLMGPTGSGKTQVLNALRQFFKEVFGDWCLWITSYMGITANNISGTTFHLALNLSTANNAQRSKLGNSDDELTYMWSGVDYLFIDEILMISCLVLSLQVT